MDRYYYLRIQRWKHSIRTNCRKYRKRIGKNKCTTIWMSTRTEIFQSHGTSFTRFLFFERNSFERGSVCRRCLPRETESMCKKIFHLKQCKQVDKKWMGGHTAAHKTITRKVHFDALMDIHKFISTCTLPRSVRQEQYYFLTWEIIWDLMNLYINKGFLLFIILARMKKS